MDRKQKVSIYITVFILIFLVFSVFRFFETAPILEEIRLAPPGYPELINITTDYDNYVKGEIINFTAEWNDLGQDSVILISEYPGFLNCDYNVQTGCLNYTFVDAVGGININHTFYNLSSTDDLQWYGRVCNSGNNCDNTIIGETKSFIPERNSHPVYIQRLIYDGTCSSQQPENIIQECEIDDTIPPDECMPNLTYIHLETDDYSDGQQYGSDPYDSYIYGWLKNKQCLHVGLSYSFDLTDDFQPESVTFTWQGYFEDNQTRQALEGRFYIRNVGGEYELWPEDNSINQIGEQEVEITYYNLNNYIDGSNTITFLAWDYEGIGKHKECTTQQTCVDVYGQGSNECEDNDDCIESSEIENPNAGGGDEPPLYSPPQGRGDAFSVPMFIYDHIYNDYVNLTVTFEGSVSSGTLDISECETNEDCPPDGWYDTGSTRWVDQTDCIEEEEKEQEYRDNYCNIDICAHTIDTTQGEEGYQWVVTGITQPKTEGTECGEEVLCPSDCIDPFARNYTEDGHDFCNGLGECIEFTCTIDTIYCTDNDDSDGVNTQECNAECDQDTDCNCPTSNCSGSENLDWYEYPPNGVCDLVTSCNCDNGENTGEPCEPEILEDDSRCSTPTVGPNVGSSTPKKQCNDKKDNDGDGRIDLEDPGCLNKYDDDETDPPAPITTCLDECKKSEKKCVNGTHYQICRNYNRDPCLEWSDIFECPSNTACDSGSCKTIVGAPTVEEPKPEPGINWWIYWWLILLTIAIAGFFFFFIFYKRRKKEKDKQKKKHPKKHKQ